MGELIAVLSGKGGTGKTTVCAGISCALALQGQKVLVIDCDVGLRNLDIALGISELGALSFTEVASGDYDLSMATCHPVYPSLRFLTAPVNCPAGSIDEEQFCKLLQDARNMFDFVLLDAPAGIEAGFSLAAKYADRIIVVTGQDPAAIRDAARADQVLTAMGKENIRLVVNRLNKKMISTTQMTIDDIMDKAGLPLLGVIPEDPNVILASSFRQPLLGFTSRGAAAACRRIARRLRGLKVSVKL